MPKIKTNMTSLTAAAFVAAPLIDTSLALEIDLTGLAEPELVGVKSKLEKLYGPDVSVYIDGKPCALAALGAGAKALTVDAMPDFDKARYNAVDAIRVTTRLTRPEDGCPWDRAQTHESIRVNLIEEAYEAVDAIDKRDIANMREEFGDVFLQSILQSDIAARNGEFDFSDVCDELCKKLIGRHTFIFGGDSAGDPDEALKFWEKAKAKEKHYDTVKNQLQRLPEEFPSLLRCQKAYKKIKKSGAAVNPEAELAAAVECRDYASVIAAACALLADEGKDAEVELNALVRRKIEKL